MSLSIAPQRQHTMATICASHDTFRYGRALAMWFLLGLLIFFIGAIVVMAIASDRVGGNDDLGLD